MLRVTEMIGGMTQDELSDRMTAPELRGWEYELMLRDAERKKAERETARRSRGR